MPNFLSKIKDLLKGGSWAPPKQPEPAPVPVKQPEPAPVPAKQPEPAPVPVKQPVTQPKSEPSRTPRKINQLGRLEIQKHEGLELEAYPDPASALGKACTAANMRMRSYRKIAGWEKLDGSPWTIGYGHTGKMLDGTPVRAGSKITKEEAERLFDQDIAEFEAGVDRLVKVPLTDNQFAALVSFAYNVGVRGLGGSTLLRKLNAGDYAGAAECFLDWAKVKDKRTGEITLLKGLAIRRKSERDLFLKED